MKKEIKMKTIRVSEMKNLFEFVCNYNLFQVFALLSYLKLGILAIPSSLDEFPKMETIPASDIIKEVGDGFHQYGDMILNDVQNRLFRNDFSELDRQAIIGEKYRWPGGIIPFKFQESTVGEAMKDHIREHAEKFSKQMEGCLTIR